MRASSACWNVIVNAKDIFNEDQLVTIKFMRSRKAFNRETRKPRPTGLLALIATSEDPELRDKWDSDLPMVDLRLPFGIVQPTVKDSLEARLLSGLGFFPMASMLMDCVRALAALHSNGYIHGSFQPSKVVREAKDSSWQLINLEASVKIGKSTDSDVYGSSPPELVQAFGHHNSRTANEKPLHVGDSAIIIKPHSSVSTMRPRMFRD